MLDKLLTESKDNPFISNLDSIAATFVLKLLECFDSQILEFMTEFTSKTRSDIIGGTLVEYGRALRLLEIAQVPSPKNSEFTGIRKFKIFNAISVRIILKSLKHRLKTEKFNLNNIGIKRTENDDTAYQTETAIGSVISFHE